MVLVFVLILFNRIGLCLPCLHILHVLHVAPVEKMNVIPTVPCIEKKTRHVPLPELYLLLIR
ncbi:MAG: hypothetical protein D6730_22515 [Bacteroidetes bacterium]|nr:MAG: hypothetical protein D6730_22515 [Bacteroidota bacterium]